MTTVDGPAMRRDRGQDGRYLRDRRGDQHDVGQRDSAVHGSSSAYARVDDAARQRLVEISPRPTDADDLATAPAP